MEGRQSDSRPRRDRNVSARQLMVAGELRALGALHAVPSKPASRGIFPMFSFRRVSQIAVTTLMLGACSSLSGPISVVEVNISGASFARVGTPAIATVPFRATNRGSASVFVARCGTRVMAAVDRWNGQAWVQYSGDACVAIYTVAGLELTPGSSAVASRTLLESGRYRVRIGTSNTASGGFEWSIVSRDFEIS